MENLTTFYDLMVSLACTVEILLIFMKIDNRTLMNEYKESLVFTKDNLTHIYDSRKSYSLFWK